MTATEPAPAAPTMTPAAMPPTPAVNPSVDLLKRLDRLERQVTTLRKRIRRHERSNPPFDLSPEMIAEIDRREAEVLSGNFVGIPWETVMAETLERLKQVRS